MDTTVAVVGMVVDTAVAMGWGDGDGHSCSYGVVGMVMDTAVAMGWCGW